MWKPKRFHDEPAESRIDQELKHDTYGTFKIIWNYINTDIQKKGRSFKRLTMERPLQWPLRR